jgi:diaminohydroxyphosphoribosylaminopyrimidine deaminase/5-amino-6-(5-phosphoribosylamino)uracil reductase
MTNTREWMSLAIDEARGARGFTSPNPSVGAIVVTNGLLAGRGHTQPPGGPHAEVMALHDAGERARGGVMYVTLEPCNTWGRTPPCTRALIEAGISAVHCALIDPDPRVRGRGVAELRAAGIRVIVGEMAGEAARTIEDFIVHRTLGRPLVVVKFAASLDGRIASVSGDARWISGPVARAWVHRQRAMLDAIMAGSGTVLADDPLLTARPEDSPPARQPLRVVVDGRGRLPVTSKVLGREAPTLVATTEASPVSWRRAVAATGAEVVVLPPDPAGGVDLEALLGELGRRQIMSVLVEGGATLLGALFDAGLVDKVQAVIAPLIIGGAAPVAVAGHGATRMADALRLLDLSVDRLGEDVLVTGYPRPLPILPSEEMDSGVFDSAG